ncbi:hypothetical protein EMIT0111MI5_150121 [Burkholderia sp. IT-111MI5]
MEGRHQKAVRRQQCPGRLLLCYGLCNSPNTERIHELSSSDHRARRLAVHRDCCRHRAVDPCRRGLRLRVAVLAAARLRRPVLPRSAAPDPGAAERGAVSGGRPHRRGRDLAGSVREPRSAEDQRVHECLQRPFAAFAGRWRDHQGRVLPGCVPERGDRQGIDRKRAQRGRDPDGERQDRHRRADRGPRRPPDSLLRACRRTAVARPALRFHPLRFARRRVPADRQPREGVDRREGLRVVDDPRRARTVSGGAHDGRIQTAPVAQRHQPDATPVPPQQGDGARSGAHREPPRFAPAVPEDARHLPAAERVHDRRAVLRFLRGRAGDERAFRDRRDRDFRRDGA